MYTLPLLLSFYNLLKNRKLSISRLEASLTIKEGREAEKGLRKKKQTKIVSKGYSVTDRYLTVVLSRLLDER